MIEFSLYFKKGETIPTIPRHHGLHREDHKDNASGVDFGIFFASLMIKYDEYGGWIWIIQLYYINMLVYVGIEIWIFNHELFVGNLWTADQLFRDWRPIFTGFLLICKTNGS